MKTNTEISGVQCQTNLKSIQASSASEELLIGKLTPVMQAAENQDSSPRFGLE